MDGVERIRAAEADVAQMQDVLAALQVGLERAEAVAVAAEKAKERTDRLVKVVLGLTGISLLLVVVSQRRRRG